MAKYDQFSSAYTP